MPDSASALTATDADNDTLTYSHGRHGRGVVRFRYVHPRDEGQVTGVTYNYEEKQNTYSVTVNVDDGNGGTDTTAVTIDITDVAEKSAKPDKPTLAAKFRARPTSLDRDLDEAGAQRRSRRSTAYRRAVPRGHDGYVDGPSRTTARRSPRPSPG